MKACRHPLAPLPWLAASAGQRRENYLDLYWYGSRWSPGRTPGTGDPAAARFIQADSIVPSHNQGTEDSRRIQVLLIVDYHESNFLALLGEINRVGLQKNVVDEPEQSGKADPLNPNPTRVSPHKQGNNTNTEDSNDTYQPLIDFNQPSDLWKPQSSDYQNSPSKDKNGNSQVDLMPTRLNSLGIDRYAYTSNCPTKYTDPSGHCDIAKAIAGGAIVGLGLIPFSLGTATMLLGSAEIAGAPLTGPFYFLPVVDGWKGIVGGGIMMAAGGGIIIVGGIFIYQSGCIQEILDDTSD